MMGFDFETCHIISQRKGACKPRVGLSSKHTLLDVGPAALAHFACQLTFSVPESTIINLQHYQLAGVLTD